MKLHEFFLSQSPDGILLIQPDGMIVDSNDEACRLFGYSKEEVNKKQVSDLLPERFRAVHFNLFKEFLDSGESARKMGEFHDLRAMKKDGSEFSAEIAIGRGDLEDRTLLIAIVRDRAVKNNAEALLRSMALFPQENPNPIIRIHLDGRVLFTNAEGKKLLETAGQANAESAPPEWMEAASLAFKSARQIDIIYRYESRSYSFVFIPVMDMSYINIYALDITEREKATNELELSDQILKSIGNLVLVANGNGEVIYISQSVKDILGYETDEVLGGGWWEIERISGGDIKAEQNYVSKAARGEIVVDNRPYEHRIMHKDGSWRWLMLADAKGPRDLLIGIGTDITDLKSIDIELKTQRDFAYTLTQTMGQGIAVTNASNEFEYINPAYGRMLGYQPEELIGKTPFDITFLEDHETIRNARSKREKGERTSYEIRLRHASGRELFALITGVPRMMEGKFGGTITVITDLTERLAMEAAIRQSEESMRALYIISSSQEHFYKKISKLLKMGAERFGLETGILSNIVDEIYTIIAVETPSGQVFPGTVYDLGETYCSKTMQFDEPTGFEQATMSAWETHPCFQRTHLEAYIGVPVTVNRRIYGTLNFSSTKPRIRKFTPADKEFLKLMSQWVGTELERLESTHQLEEYASEIAQNNRELAIARDRALEASRVKSGFLATMSHEIRTPMNAIIGMNEILMESELTEEQREFAGIVGSSAQALLAIINDILDFSKIEAGKLVLHPEAFEVQKLTQEIVDMFTPLAAEKGLLLEVQMDEHLPQTLFGDAGRIRQVLINLVGNALKFTERGLISLQINGTMIQGIAHVVTFSVQDTGIGIPEWLQPQLFESFTQANESMTRKHGGTGLGLAISRRLVELMNGEIGFESVEGRGSTFWFSLPLGHKPLGAPQIKKAVSASSNPSPTFNVSKPVLIVEDDEINRTLLIFQLRKLGLASFAVSSGKDAIELLTIRPHDFCLTLMDIGMPDLDGLSTTRIIRQHETKTGKHSIIIANTASAMAGHRETCLEAGMDDFITKPAMIETIHAVFEKWL